MRGFPVSSSGSRTVIGDSLGSKSQLYSLVVVVIVVLTLLFLGPLLETFPQAALAALVVWAATRLVDIPELVRIGRFRISELVLALSTTVAVLVVDILYGILVAIALSILDLLRRVARPHDGVLGYAPGVAGMHDIDDYPDAKQVPGLLVYRYDSPLFFANAEDFKNRALESIEEHGPIEWLLLNFEANVHIDLTSIDALGELLDAARGARHHTRAGTRETRDAGGAGAGGTHRADRRRPHLRDPAYVGAGIPRVLRGQARRAAARRRPARPARAADHPILSD